MVNRRRRLALAAALIISTCSPWAMAPGFAQTVKNDKITTLSNGLRVVVIEEPAFPVISSQLWVRVGSLNDPFGSSGACHVVEHLLAETLKANGGSLARKLVGSGARFDAFTSDDFTVFVENLPSAQLELALTLQSERLKSKAFTAKQLEEAARQVIQELDNSQSNPDRTLVREVRSLVYTRHPYKNLPAGVEEEIKNLKPDAVSSFYNQNFVPANATLVIAGDVKQAQAVKMAEKFLGSIPAKKQNVVSDPLPHEPVQPGERRVYLKYGGKKNKLLIAFHAPSASENTAATASVVESLLGNTSGGLLKSSLIDTKVGDSVSTAFELRKLPSMMTISVEAPGNANAAKMLSAVEELIDKMKDGGFDDADLAEAKKHSVFSWQKNRIGPYKAAFQLGFFDSLAKIDQFDLWQRQLEAVTKQDVMRFVASYLVPSKRSVGFMLAQTSTPSSQKTASRWRPLPPEQLLAANNTDESGRQILPLSLKDRSELGRLSIAAYDPYVDGPKLDEDEPSDEAPDQQTDLAPSDSKPSTSVSPSDKPTSEDAPKKDTPKTDTPKTETTKTDGKEKPATITAPSQSAKPAVVPPTTEPAVVSNTAPQALSGLRANMTEFILVNGIRLIVFRVDSCPVVRITGAVRAGHVYDPGNKPGLSDVNVALMNGSSQKISKENSLKMQSQIGLDRVDQIRFSEGREYITFHSNCLATDLPTQLKLISHHLTDPLLDDSSLSAARNTVAGAIKRRQNTVQDRANRLLLQNLLSDKSQFNPPSPHELLASVLKINAEDVAGFRGSNIAPATTTIVLAGNIDPQNAQRMVALAFKDWQGKTKSPAVSAVANKRQVTKVNLPTEEPVKVELAIGRLLPTPASKPNFSRLLLADCALLKHPLFARLNNASRLKVDLDDSIVMHSSIIPMAAQSTWLLNVRVPEPKLRGITGAIKQQFKEIGTTGLNQAELSEMQRYVSGQLAVTKLADIVHGADSIVDSISMEREPDYWFNMPSTIEKTTLGDINSFIKDEFQPDRSCLVVAGDKKALKQVPSLKRGKD